MGLQREHRTAPPAQAPSADDIDELATTFSSLMRAYKRAYQHFLAKAEREVEWTSQVLLSCVANEGPLRASALAGLIDSDPSTVSRQVAQLVRDGYVERRADQADGRASLLVATEKGMASHREHCRMRNERYRRMLSEWSERDIRKFTTLLRRFTADFEAHRKSWFDDLETTGES
jgi:DNA-binding MarR family transcriptional regulator